MHWKCLEPVEYATLEWFNNCWLMKPIGNIPPAEREMEYYRLEESSEAAWLKRKQSSGNTKQIIRVEYVV
jgi:hypothetical protein